MRPNELDDLFVDTLDAMIEAINDAEGRMSEHDNRKRMGAAPTLLAQAFEILEEQRHGILAAQQRQLDHLSLSEENVSNEDKATDAVNPLPRESGAQRLHAPKSQE